MNMLGSDLKQRHEVVQARHDLRRAAPPLHLVRVRDVVEAVRPALAADRHDEPVVVPRGGHRHEHPHENLGRRRLLVRRCLSNTASFLLSCVFFAVSRIALTPLRHSPPLKACVRQAVLIRQVAPAREPGRRCPRRARCSARRG